MGVNLYNHLRGWAESCVHQTKAIVPIAHFADGLIGRSSLHEHDVKCVTFTFEVKPMKETLTVFMDVLQSCWLRSHNTALAPSCWMD